MIQLNAFQSFREYDDHRFITYLNDPRTGLVGFIAFHRGSGGTVPSFGATRINFYPNTQEALKDCLRLSRFMSYKSALSGLKYGGAKGVMLANFKNPKQKNSILRCYAEKVNLLGGKFLTGADVGINNQEVRVMKSVCPY